MRQQVSKLLALGPLPDESTSPEEIDKYANILASVSRPVTNEEAKALVKLFGPDECYGVAWTLLHLIETAPGWPIMESLQDDSNEWVSLLRQRARRSGK
jgi:hypothetical protein